ncbi:hypothetical protein [Spirosoma sp. KUDC1026]|uniref:hypothetical protein n=1 Tax=Spirosoma sp. KUDC1026 TaxID=2745947 RepID=UPI00159BE573|nr:hypothetical protein [Spirosoma sp. KUDC1026]QKZ14743.1 hypothetical protein HU175_19790 [Spirosoma sp. KUDC1026]
MTHTLPVLLFLCLLAFACKPKESHTADTKSADSLTESKAIDFQIIPGERVGPIQFTTSEADLLRRFGPSVVTAGDTIYGAEGEEFVGTTLYKGTVDEVQILYQDSSGRLHPELILIRPTTTDDEGNPLPNLAPTRWQTADGLRIGTQLSELEKRNGKPFKLWGFGWDYGGNISDWQGGKMSLPAGESLLALTLGPPATLTTAQEKAYGQVMGDSEFLSSFAPMKRLNPEVQAMHVSLGQSK